MPFHLSVMMVCLTNSLLIKTLDVMGKLNISGYVFSACMDTIINVFFLLDYLFKTFKNSGRDLVGYLFDQIVAVSRLQRLIGSSNNRFNGFTRV